MAVVAVTVASDVHTYISEILTNIITSGTGDASCFCYSLIITSVKKTFGNFFIHGI